MTVEQLIAVIEKAFAEVTFPNTVSLRQARLVDDWSNSPVRAQRALEQDYTGAWQDVPDADIREYGSTYFAYSDAASAQFYLPAFLCYCLRHWNHSDSILFWLLCYAGRLEPTGLHHPGDRLTAEQKAAVAAFLHFAANHAPDRHDAELAEDALLNYWSDFCDALDG